MLRALVKFFDIVISGTLAALFLLLVAVALVISMVAARKKKNVKGISELYMSIIDFRRSIISSQVDDILLGGFIRRAFCYHLDFDKDRGDRAWMGPDVHMAVISVHPAGLFTGMGLRTSAACLAEMRVFFDMFFASLKAGVNIIRAHDPHLLGFNALLLSRLLKIPFMVQICSNYELKDRAAKRLAFRPFVFKAVERAFERVVMMSSDMVIADREHYRSFGLIPRDLPGERYANIGFFVDRVHYDAPGSRKDLRSELNISGGTNILLYVGRLCEVKYTLDLARMLEEVLKKRADVVLLIAGDGELKEGMAALAEARGIRRNIIFLQKMRQEKLKDLYHTADVVCFTSAGFTMIEAALAERCIVAYDFEWHREFIGSDERGILAPFGDHKAFAEKVLQALDSPGLRKSLAAAARAHALKNYSKEDSIKREIEAYRNVFKRRGMNFEKAL